MGGGERGIIAGKISRRTIGRTTILVIRDIQGEIPGDSGGNTRDNGSLEILDRGNASLLHAPAPTERFVA
jgi:hypothetical protein